MDLKLSIKRRFKNWSVWSEPDKPFVCVEPWTGGINAIFNPKERIEIQPNGEEVFSIKIERV
jgi:galactose mutarotase-like enzyme